ncbi:MAG: RNA 2'-phosphotransferase [Bacteroidota bacterium]
MTTTELRRKSKFLSLVLRHQPEKIDLTLDANGWAKVEQLIHKASKHKINFTMELLEKIIETNDKKRFTFNEDKTKIRANQGHSIEIDLDLQLQMPPVILYHGTAERNVDSIRANGIDKRKRQHVHLSHELETARKVGSRHGKPTILHIDAKQMYNDGCQFYLSKNGVWLTEFIHPKYIL